MDSSAWIAYISARDQHHRQADHLLRTAVGARMRLLTTNLVLAEVHRLLLFRAGVEAAGAALDRINASALVTIEYAGAGHHRSARAWLRKLAPHPVTYTDAVSFSVMEEAGCTQALSFDRHFFLAGFSAWR